MDVSGIEPEAFRIQIERDTTTPYTLSIFFNKFNAFYIELNST